MRSVLAAHPYVIASGDVATSLSTRPNHFENTASQFERVFYQKNFTGNFNLAANAVLQGICSFVFSFYLFRYFVWHWDAKPNSDDVLYTTNAPATEARSFIVWLICKSHFVWLHAEIDFLNPLKFFMLSLLLFVAGLVCFWLFFKSIDFFEKI